MLRTSAAARFAIPARPARIIGYTPSAGFVLTVIVDPADNSGVTAWKARGADLREYLEGREADS